MLPFTLSLSVFGEGSPCMALRASSKQKLRDDKDPDSPVQLKEPASVKPLLNKFLWLKRQKQCWVLSSCFHAWSAVPVCEAAQPGLWTLLTCPTFRITRVTCLFASGKGGTFVTADCTLRCELHLNVAGHQLPPCKILSTSHRVRRCGSRWSLDSVSILDDRAKE